MKPFWIRKHDFLCLKVIGMLYENRSQSEIISVVQDLYLENFLELRYNDGSNYTKDEHGRFTGSTSSGGGGIGKGRSKLSARLKAYSNGGGSGYVKTDDRFEIAPEKIQKFLLLPGAKHSKEFFDVGYKSNDYEKLFDDIAANFDIKKKTDVKPNDTAHKDTFSIFMKLGVTKKKSFRTVWEQSRNAGSKPRLITAHREG